MAQLFLKFDAQVQHVLALVPVAPDERTRSWPLMNLSLALEISIAYVLFASGGRRILGSLLRELDLKYFRILHNFMMTAINLYLVIEMLAQASQNNWYGPIVRGPKGHGLARVLWVFYATKLFEFLDTVIMVFRHKYDQISFLHVYHHVSVFLIWWFNVYYYPGGEAWPSAWLNSFVHVWMYSYYLLSTVGFNPFWKRYLTQLQITQLALFVLQGVHLFFTGDPSFAFIGLINGIYAATILVLFLNFYISSYLSGSKRRSGGHSEKQAGQTNGDETKKKK